MEITSLERTKKGNYALHINGRFFASISEELVHTYHLKSGLDVPFSFLEDLLRESNEKKTKERAFALIARRDYSECELKERLLRYGEPDDAESAVLKMVELGLVNDSHYAERLASDLFSLKKYGTRKVSYELKRKGISDEIIEEILERAPDPAEQLMSLLHSRFKNYPKDPKGMKKLTDALYRLGYEWEDIRSAVSSFMEDTES